MTGCSDMIWHPGQIEFQIDAELARWADEKCVERLWKKDASLWTGQDEGKWLGWLDSVEWMQSQVDTFTEFAQAVRDEGFTDVLVLGMGGSSLCPEVLTMSFGQQSGWPALHVLDSTVPEQVHRFAQQLDLTKTLFVVASKSGTTTEPNAFYDYFWAEAEKAVGDQMASHFVAVKDARALEKAISEKVGSQFVAITDPDSALQHLAESKGFRRVFLGRPEIGGRFSALSPFGLVPAALMGLDLGAFLSPAADMVMRCQKAPDENPGVILGVILGMLARAGRDKMTLITAPKIWDFGAWLEQLIAESTGKDGVGIVPVDLESVAGPDMYGADRVFVQVRLENEPDSEQDENVQAFIQAGYPVLQITVPHEMALGAEFFRWEIATAVAGAILNIHPFNQPNVQESKDFTAQLTAAYEETGALPDQPPGLIDEVVAVFADSTNASVIAEDLETTVKQHLQRLQAGDYVAICAYLDMREDLVHELTDLRLAIRNHFRVATTLGFGPRFLHSTGQLHKGGGNNVLILQLTAKDTQDLDIPGRAFSFGILKDAQALGDASALSQRNRRALRIHFQDDLKGGIQRLISIVEGA